MLFHLLIHLGVHHQCLVPIGEQASVGMNIVSTQSGTKFVGSRQESYHRDAKLQMNLELLRTLNCYHQGHRVSEPCRDG